MVTAVLVVALRKWPSRTLPHSLQDSVCWQSATSSKYLPLCAQGTVIQSVRQLCTPGTVSFNPYTICAECSALSWKYFPMIFPHNKQFFLKISIILLSILILMCRGKIIPIVPRASKGWNPTVLVLLLGEYPRLVTQGETTFTAVIWRADTAVTGGRYS